MELPESKGWSIYYSCMCGGSLKQYYSNPAFPSYEIRIRPTKNTFAIWCRNMQIYGPDWMYKLEDKMKEYQIYEVAQ